MCVKIQDNKTSQTQTHNLYCGYVSTVRCHEWLAQPFVSAGHGVNSQNCSQGESSVAAFLVKFYSACGKSGLDR